MLGRQTKERDRARVECPHTSLDDTCEHAMVNDMATARYDHSLLCILYLVQWRDRRSRREVGIHWAMHHLPTS